MKSIGGYFELELINGKEFHLNALRLNTGRNALEYILLTKGFNKIYIPLYSCEAIIEPLKKTKTPFEFYSLNNQFDPVLLQKPKKGEALLYINYFGIKGNTVINLSKQSGSLIIDNSQAFFDYPAEGTHTFYSCRKFFGVPDGAYLYTDAFLEGTLKQDNSLTRFDHLIRRIEDGPEKGYFSFLKDENSLGNLPILSMSKLTRRMLENIDYLSVIKKRRDNFLFLHNFLKNKNKFDFKIETNMVPMVYPFLSENVEMRSKLIKNNIFVAQYWPNVLLWADEKSIEHKFASELVCLPVDQRYGIKEMKSIVNKILKK